MPGVLVVGWEFLELPGDGSNSWGSAVGPAEAGGPQLWTIEICVYLMDEVN